MDRIIEKTMKNLEKNNISAFYAESREEVAGIIKSLVPAGSTVSNGGSETLAQTGVMDLLSGGDYVFYDRRGLEGEELRACYVRAFGCDAYFCSSNAITENGELYNVDGNSNRVACIVYGPKQVIMVAGKNKIVPDLASAVNRVKQQAAPRNTVRLHKNTPCAATGQCISLGGSLPELCAGCRTPERICCNFVVSAYQRHKGRIKVILVNEDLGY